MYLSRDTQGFSTSGSLLIVFFGLFIALGTLYTVTSNTSERLVDAYDDELSHQNDIERTDITITDANWHTTDGNLTIRVNNTGATELSVGESDAFVDGEYWAPDDFQLTTVDGQPTDVWGLQEQLRLENDTTQPTRVKVVTETGVAAAEFVSAVGIAFTGDAVSKDNTSSGTNEAIEFNITSTYDENVTLLDVTVANATVDGADNPTHLNYTENPNEEVYLATEPDLGSSETTASGNFSIGETIVPDDTVVLEPDQIAQYTIGAFRNSTGGVVSMLSANVTVSITYADPNGVQRTLNFETEVDN
jgi:flagellar protein FlaF